MVSAPRNRMTERDLRREATGPAGVWSWVSRRQWLLVAWCMALQRGAKDLGNAKRFMVTVVLRVKKKKKKKMVKLS